MKSTRRHLPLCVVDSKELPLIWDIVSDYVKRQMITQKGVTIPGLGIFSFEQLKLDVGINKYLLIQRPVFQLKEKFCKTHALKQTKHAIESTIAVPPLNFCALSQGQKYDRDTLESAVREIISCLHLSIAEGKKVVFAFNTLGRLLIHDSKAKFKFHKDFIQCLEHGKMLLDVMQNRPGTADSVMSDRPPSRAYSHVLPNGNGKPSMETIPENAETSNEQNQVKPTTFITSPQADNSGSATQRVQVPVNIVGEVTFCPGDSNDAGNAERPTTNTQEVDPSVPVTPCWGLGSQNGQPLDNGRCERTSRLESRNSSTRPDLTPVPSLSLHQESAVNCSPTPSLGPPLNHRLLTNRSKTCLSVSDFDQHQRTSSRSSCRTCCSSGSHPTSAGQELCYLCHQRASRNVPVSFAKELRKKEDEEDRLLRTYQEMQANEHLMQERERLLAKRHESQKVSAFNHGVAEAVKEKNRFKDPRYFPSYLMLHRADTPPKHIEQDKLRDVLTVQIALKRNTEEKKKEDKALLDKLEQERLAEEIEKEKQLAKERQAKKRKEYLADLDVQVKNKPEQLPARVPDSEDGPVFGKNDVNEQKLLERRRIAQNLQLEQMETVNARKKDALMKQIAEQRSDEEMVKWARENLLQERAARYHRHVQTRKELENDWRAALEAKQERDLEEQWHRTLPDQMPVHEQCDKYHRCAQCRRRLQNVGESNVWRESYYIPGTRFIC